MDDLFDLRDRLAAAGFWVSEAMDQGFVRSIYSFDPNGVPVEFSVTVPEPISDRCRSSRTVTRVLSHPRAQPRNLAPGRNRMPRPPVERVMYPGAGSEYFHGIKE